jgi:hypothetical protein
METNLPLGQINPAARPVQDFIRPGQFQPAGIAAPPGMPQLQGITQLQGPSQSSYGGVNRFADLAEALAPFNRALTSTLQTGAEGLASWASQRGEAQANKEAMNAALRALSTADRTNEAGAYDYAAANRKLAQRDPDGGFLMDLLNPYREAGVRRGLAKLAGAEAATGAELAYERGMDPRDFWSEDRGLSKLTKIKASYVAQLAQKYGLDTTTPGFINYALPKIESAWEKVQTKAAQDRTGYMREEMPRLATAELDILVNDVLAQKSQGLPFITIDDNGQPVQIPADNSLLVKTALMAKATTILDRYAGQMGIGADASKLPEAVYKSLRAKYSTNATVLEILDGIKAGPEVPDPKTGRPIRFTLAQRYLQERIDTDFAYKEKAWSTYKREDEQVKMLGSNAFLGGYTSRDGSTKIPGLYQPDASGQVPELDKAGLLRKGNAIINAILRDNPNANPATLLQSLKEQIGLVSDLQISQYQPDAGLAFIQEIGGLYGNNFNPKEIRERLPGVLRDVAPGNRSGIAAKVEAEIQRKEGKGTTTFRKEVSDTIARARSAAISNEYGKRAAAANRDEALKRYDAAVFPFVEGVLGAAAAKKGRALTREETISLTNEALTKFSGTTDQEKAAYRGLFPDGKASGLPALPGTRSQPPDPFRPSLSDPRPKPPGAYDPSTIPDPKTMGPRPVEKVDEIRTMSKRQERLQRWESQAFMSKNAVLDEIQRLGSGQPFSPALRQAAVDARTNPASLLRRQAELNNLQFSEEAVKDLNKRSDAVTTPQRALVAASSQASGLLAKAARWWIDAATGTQPAAAAGWGPTGGGGSFTMTPRGGGGGSGGFDAPPPPPPGAFRSGGGAPDPRTLMATRSSGVDHGGLARLISSGEGGYNSVNTGTTGSGRQINLASMTIGQVEKMQKTGQVFAAGFAQWIPGNLAKARRAAGLSPDAPMSPNNQQAMFWAYVLNSDKQPALRDYLTGASNNLDAAHRALAGEWAAVKGPDGRGRYDGDKAGNMASIDHRQVRQALIQARQSITRRRG